MASTARPLKRAIIKPEQEQRRRFIVVENERHKQQKALLEKIRRFVLSVAAIALVCGVLYTQAQITTVQNQIEKHNSAYAEEISLNDMLMYQIESRVNVQFVEEQARQMGLIQRQNNQTVYVRMEEEVAVQNGEPTLLERFENMWNNFSNWLGI